MNAPGTILIVDDDPTARKNLEGLLRPGGYQLFFAADGPEALTQAAMLVPDLILLDVMLPVIDGFEVCRWLRAHPQLAEVPIIIVTALDDRDSMMHGLEAGADDFVTKPIDRVELRARVRTITRLNRYRRLLEERNQRQHAEEEMRRRNRELTLLNGVITTAASTLDVEEALHTACSALAHAFDLPQTTALLLSDDRAHCSVVAEYPFISRLDPAHLRIGDDQVVSWLSSFGEVIPVADVPTLAYVLDQNAPLVANDAQHDPRLAGIAGLLEACGVVSLMSVPIFTRDRIVGIVELSARGPRTFDDQDIALAQSIATAAGQAMEVAQLYQQLRRYAYDLEELVAQRTHELQTERDRTRSILDALGEAIVVTDEQGLIRYVNPAAAELTGFSADEMLGQSWRAWQGDRQPVTVGTEIQETVLGGRIWRGEVVSKRQDGSLFTAALTIAPLINPRLSERPVGFVSIQRDITTLKEAERLKDQFVSNVSHELRTPLSVLTLLCGNLDTLYGRLDEAQRRSMIRDMREQTRVLSELIEDVLEISRIDSGSLAAERQPLNLALLAREEADRQSPLALRKDQRICVIGEQRVSVEGNDGQLRQVIRNLLNNAIKYTPEQEQITLECRVYDGPSAAEERPTTSDHDQRLASGRVVIRPYIRRADDAWPGLRGLPDRRWAALRVTDTGGGIGQQELARIFERFYRVKAQGNVPGTGLGLSIARELVELHDGQIAVASTLGKGSSFAIYLPLLEEA